MQRISSLVLAGLLVLVALAASVAGAEGAAPWPAVSAEPGQPAALNPGQQARLHPALYRALLAREGAGWTGTTADPADEEYIPIVIEWRRAPLSAPETAAAPDRTAARRQLVAALQADAELTAGPLRRTLEAAAAECSARHVRPFWASPVIALEARPALIRSLAQRDDILQIRPDERISLEGTDFQTLPSAPIASGLPWNLAMLQVDLAQQALGLDGAGIVVANLDTGVDWQHPALLTKYRGYRERGPAVHWGNWHVSTNEPYLYPGDGNGHGTHTMGTILGDDGEGNRLGVAPGARWIAVKVFDNAGYTYESWIHDAFQWILAPEGDPALAPDVVSNSWGASSGSDDRFRPDVAVLRAAGILPIFAAGNKGPAAGTVSSPGSLPEALAVGAVDEEKAIATFSGRGPSPWGEFKPEVVAPGVNIVSAFPGGGYASAAGTSMATPHVAGLAALLLQASPDLSPAQLESLLTATAEPLGASAPNNATGWGLVNAYAAGLRVTQSGELTGQVLRSDGSSIARPTVTAVLRDGTGPVTASGDAMGRFTIALRPGRYDVTARAFGFDPATRYAVEVFPGLQTNTTFTLTAQPAGAFFGRVTDLQSGAPLSATIAVEGTPLVVQTDANTGLYSLALPAGEYSASITAEAHRIGRLRMVVAPGVGQEANIALRPAPRILLIDSGRWYYGSQIAYFQDALTALDYPYVLWPVRDPFGLIHGLSDRPTEQLLSRYDVAIWSAPLDSPGYTGSDAALVSYLQSGGHLLVSGQDVAYWDAGGSLDPWPSPYFTDLFGLWFASEGNLAALQGVAGSPLDGLTVLLNTPDSARQQTTPDAAAVKAPLLASPALRWPGGVPPVQDWQEGTIGATTAGTCRAYRGAWLGFGLEGAGPRPTRIEALGRLLDWFAAPPAPYGLVISAETAPLIGLPGTAVSQTLRVDSVGVRADTLHLRIEGGRWPLELRLPDGRQVGSDTTLALDGCSGGVITATVTIPEGAPRDARSAFILRFTSQGDPAQTAAVTITAKTPAAILFVDDERWYNYQDRYTSALDALDLSYDLLDTRGGRFAPNASILKRYPLVVWTTGYDWYAPLTAGDEANLADFLDAGGRLLLSSQDLLDARGLSDFVRTRLGVVRASLTITATDVVGMAGSPLGPDLGPWRLLYPFSNWSDAVTVGAPALGTLQDEHQHTVGVAHPAANWRTMFFSFPLETLSEGARQTLLGRALVWLSPLGESRLEAPPVAAEGTRIPITLTLGLAADRPRGDLRAVLPLPTEAAVTPGSIRGPWRYEAATHTLAWNGSLSPGDSLLLGADLDLATDIPNGTTLALRASLYAGDGVTVTADAPVQIDVPWLGLHESVLPASTVLGSTVEYTLTVTNAGFQPTTGQLTVTLPSGLTPVPGTAWASSGTPRLNQVGLIWSGPVPPGAQVEIGYRARVGLVRAGALLTDRAELTDDRGRRTVAWATVRVPAYVYLPMIRK